MHTCPYGEMANTTRLERVAFGFAGSTPAMGTPPVMAFGLGNHRSKQIGIDREHRQLSWLCGHITCHHGGIGIHISFKY